MWATHALSILTHNFMTFFLCVHKDGVCSNTCMIKCNAQFYYIFCYRSGTQRWGMWTTHALSVLTHNFINFFVTGIFGYMGNTYIKYINAQFY